MSGNTLCPRVVTEFVLRVPEGWAGCLADATKALAAAGAFVTRVVADRRVLAGVIDHSRLGDLARLPCAQDMVEGATYIIGGSEHESCSAAAGSLFARSTGPQSWLGADARKSRCTPVRRRPADLLDPPLEDAALGEKRWSDPGEADEARAGRSACANAAGTARTVPWAAYLGYGLVAVLAGGLLVHAALQDTAGTRAQSLVQMCGIALLFGLATMAAIGFWRHRIVRHACTALALLVTVLPCLLWNDDSLTRVVTGLATFLIAGTTGDSLPQSR